MSDSKLFSWQGDQAQELAGSTASRERDLQQQVAPNMPMFLGVQFLATEYNTGKTHTGFRRVKLIRLPAVCLCLSVYAVLF